MKSSHYDYPNCSCVSCPMGCSCHCGNDPWENGCTCHLDPNVRLKEDTVLLEMKGLKVPLMQISAYFNYLFPNQILIPDHLRNKVVTFSFKDLTVKYIIRKLKLITITENLIPRFSLGDVGTKKYCCHICLVDPNTGKPMGDKYVNYTTFPKLAKETCQYIVGSKAGASGRYCGHEEGKCNDFISK